MQTSVVVAPGLENTGSVVVVHELSYLLHGMWDLPGPGISPMYPVLTGGFFTTEPEALLFAFLWQIYIT